jgi:hypothetical protein
LGDYVVSRLWLGKVAEVSLHVDVAFDDGGALCTLTTYGMPISLPSVPMD